MTVVKDLEASNTSVVSVQVVSDSLNIVEAFIENIKSLFDVVPDKKVNLVKTYMISAPFTVPHLFWGASVAPQNTLPISFDCPLDNGSLSSAGNLRRELRELRTSSPDLRDVRRDFGFSLCTAPLSDSCPKISEQRDRRSEIERLE